MSLLLVVASWVLIGAIVVPIGLGVLRMSGIETQDRLLIATWVGLFTWAFALLALSMVVPLSPWVVWTLSALVSGALMSRPWVQAELRHIPGLPLAAIALVVAGLLTVSPRLYDLGLYHYQMIMWLAEHGSVPGMALVHERLGFTSIWFAAHAPFEAGALSSRAYGIPAGFAFVAALLQVATSTKRVLGGRAQTHDWVLMIGLISACAYSYWRGLATSPSPDLPVALLAVLVGSRLTARKPDRLAVLFGLFAVAIKLSAAPIFMAAVLHYVWSARSVTLPVLWSVLAGLPLIAVNIVTTGCIAFPVAITCMEPVWGVSADQATVHAQAITDWARWGGRSPESYGLEWIPHWLAETRWRAILQISAVVMGSALALSPSVRWPAALSAGGAAFVLVAGPDLRFSYGYVVLLGGVALAWCSTRIERHATRRYLVGGAMAVVVILSLYVLAGFARSPELHPWQPPSLTQFRDAMETRQAANFEYRVPMSDDRCWDAPLPCAPNERDFLVLRHSEVGLSGGFRRE